MEERSFAGAEPIPERDQAADQDTPERGSRVVTPVTLTGRTVQPEHVNPYETDRFRLRGASRFPRRGLGVLRVLSLGAGPDTPLIPRLRASGAARCRPAVERQPDFLTGVGRVR